MIHVTNTKHFAISRNVLFGLLSVTSILSLTFAMPISSVHDARSNECKGSFASLSKPGDSEALEQKVLDIFDSSSTLPLSISRPREGIEVRTKFDGDRMVTIGEAKMVRKHPDNFKDFLTNFNDSFPKVNPMAQSVHHLEKDENNSREGVKSILKFPYPLKNRVMIHWKYPVLNRGKNKDEHMLIFSEDGNEDLLKKYLTPKDKKDFELARTFLCAYWVKPVYDDSENKKIIGTSIRYAFSGDTGGSIPKWVQNAVGPKTALDSVKGLIKHVT